MRSVFESVCPLRQRSNPSKERTLSYIREDFSGHAVLAARHREQCAPVSCPYPHGFTIDVMAQGGASGSPIFLPDRPLAVGILHAGFEGTNITYGVPSTILAKGLVECLKSSPLDLTGVPTLADLVARSERNDILTWEPFRTGI